MKMEQIQSASGSEQSITAPSTKVTFESFAVIKCVSGNHHSAPRLNHGPDFYARPVLSNPA
jgi:hypothetical protein